MLSSDSVEAESCQSMAGHPLSVLSEDKETEKN
jgi:hypothetical protein